MSDPMIILLCVASYVTGGIAGMATVLIMRAAKRADRQENLLGKSADRFQGA
jgi:hypothetical protein